MGPAAAANQLTKAWRTLHAGTDVYPVKAEKVAEALNIRVISEELEPAFVAALLVRGTKKAIVINESIRDSGRKNFCIAHELGHHSLHLDRPELRCTWEDLTDTAPHPGNIEQEANKFAATLLLPADDFRQFSAGLPLSVETAAKLAGRYGTSLTAAAIRLVELTPERAALVFFKDGQISRSSWSQQMRWPVAKGKRPEVAGNDAPVAGEIHHWFADDVARRIDRDLFVSTKLIPRYNTALALLWLK